ncbi:Uncharacterized protein FWK35_00033098, partial [Aphis craccivora]
NHQVIDIPRRLVQYRSPLRSLGRENNASRIYDEVPLGLHHHQDIIINIELKETHKFIIVDFEFSMVKRTSMVITSGAMSNSLKIFEISKLEGRPLLLPINEKARPMVEKELQVAVKEIKRMFVCKTELRDACLDQLRQSLTSTRNNLTGDYIENDIRQGNKKNIKN